MNITMKSVGSKKPTGKIGKLPRRPSKLIRIALKDLAAAEKRDNVSIDMNYYHAILGTSCVVCLAGACVIGTLGHEIQPRIDVIKLPEWRALSAINAFRRGCIEQAFMELGIGLPNNILSNVSIVSYNTSPKKFVRQMNELANALEKEGY